MKATRFLRGCLAVHVLWVCVALARPVEAQLLYRAEGSHEAGFLSRLIHAKPTDASVRLVGRVEHASTFTRTGEMALQGREEASVVQVSPLAEDPSEASPSLWWVYIGGFFLMLTVLVGFVLLVRRRHLPVEEHHRISQSDAAGNTGQAGGHDPQQIALPPGTFLDNNRYKIQYVLGEPGGYGITYRAWDINLKATVAIKEFLPRLLVGRAADGKYVTAHGPSATRNFQYGLERFWKEAHTLEHFDYRNIVRVRTAFKENGTAYFVMDYYEGMTLQEYLDKQGGRLPEKKAIRLINPILDGLREVHRKNFLHRDVKPHNIYLAKTDYGSVRPILLDFGSAREAIGERTQSLTVVLTQGYAPLEQYSSRGKQGPWTDVYAAGATLYRMVAGSVPPFATDRVDQDDLEPPPGVSSALGEAIMKAMALKPADRFPSVEAFQEVLLPLSGERPGNPSEAPIHGQEIDALIKKSAEHYPQVPGRPQAVGLKASSGRRTIPVSNSMLVHFTIGLGVVSVLLLVLGSLGIFQTRPPGPNGVAFWSNSIAMEFVQIPPGTFEMGYIPGRDDEKPVHRVQISRPFYLGRYEVTQKQWFDVMGTRPWQNRQYVREGEDYPAVFVSWEDVQEFIRRLNALEGGGGYRLPTEAQWEYACRAGSTAKYSFGDDDELDTYAWYLGNTFDAEERFAHRVSQKQPNGWALYDMHGNVEEWVADWYGYYGQDAGAEAVDPQGPETGDTRVIRGGSMRDNEPSASQRNSGVPATKLVRLGFRLAWDQR